MKALQDGFTCCEAKLHPNFSVPPCFKFCQVAV